MLDFLGIVTKVSRRFQQGKLIVLEIPTIIDDYILVSLIRVKNHLISVLKKFDADENKIDQMQL